MIRASGAVAVAVAALLVCCNADPHQEQDGVGDHSTGERYDGTEYGQREDFEKFLQLLLQYDNQMRERNLNGIGGSTLLGLRNLGGIGGSSLIGRNSYNPDRNYHGSYLMGRNLNGLGGSSLLGKEKYARFIDSLGGGNFVRNLDSIGGGNFVRNLDSIGGGNFVKKNLDQIGGPNLVKRNLDSLGGGNLVRNLDSIGGGNFVRQVDPLGGHKPRNLDPLGGGNLVRQVRESRQLPFLMARRYEYGSPYGVNHDPWSLGYYSEGLHKRNFDEIDRSNMNTFVKKRNFDEIDQTSMPFPFKRFYRLFGSNYLDTPVSSLDKKRYRPDYPMDEIDLSQFPIGSKRSDNFLSSFDKKRSSLDEKRYRPDYPMDEIDLSQFPIGSKRSDSLNSRHL